MMGKSNKVKIIANVFVLFIFFIIGFPQIVSAKTEAEYNAEIADLEQKISTAQNSARTLSNQIIYYNAQIDLANVKIDQTVDQIKSYSEKIDLLEGKLSEREKLLMHQIVDGYKKERIQPLESLIGEGSFRKFLASFTYNRQLQTQSRKFLYDTQYIQTTYKSQKSLVESSQAKLKSQKIILASLRDQKNQLLNQTKNDESTYQRLLAQAKAAREALRSAVLGFGGNHILPPQPSPDGWYFNQRDERWGNLCIGTCAYSPRSYVWEVGCLITSVAMLWKKNGIDVTPGEIASNSSYFFEDLMRNDPRPAQPGFKFTDYAVNFTKIDAELAAGRPVLVRIYIGGGNGGEHFVVFKSKQGSSYIINDPYFGPDLKFSDRYSLSRIISFSTYTRT